MLVDEINHGSAEQSRGVEQVSLSMLQMKQATEDSAANAEQGSTAAEDLNIQAEGLGVW
jgi:methyl-accepting chemotaxis protein